MKFGVCVGTNVENMRYAKSLGYDYVEVHCQEIANKPIEHIEAMKAVGMPILAANCFIGMRVIGRGSVTMPPLQSISAGSLTGQRISV